MPHVFVSYRREDGDFAEILVGRIEKMGFSAWVDSRIRPGEEWRTEIDSAIRNSFALIVVMTPEARFSEYVTYEWAFAWGIGIQVIPAVLRPTPLHPRLDSLEYLDFSQPIRPWQELLDALRDAANAPRLHSVSMPPTAPPFVRKAVAALDSATPDERRAAIDTLTAANTPPARLVLNEALKHPLPDVRASAASSLRAVGDASAVPALIEALQDGDMAVRDLAAEALGKIGDASAVPTLIQALQDGDVTTRVSAIRALGTIGQASAEPALRAATGDSQYAVAWAADQALTRIRVLGGDDPPF